MGRTRDSKGDTVGHEAGLTDADCAELLSRALSVLSPRRAGAVRLMSTTIGSQLPGADRVKARAGRLAAARLGIAMPPWWRLRLAARRTAAYQTAQDSPGSTPAGQG